MNILPVWWQRQRVGMISLDVPGRMEFRYAAEWLENRAAFPISVSLPLQADAHRAPAHAFFANLLPEADVRSRLCLRLKVTPGNDFELLRRIGGECAGALTLADEPPGVSFSSSDYRRIRPEQLRLWSRAETPDAFASTVGRDGVRLSLPGAQDKLPVRLDGSDASVPLGQAPSTHLLKFGAPHFKYLPENEFFLGLIAVQLGLPVPSADLWRVKNGGAILVVERYDRRHEEGSIRRLHQEDFCQALGRDPLRKYQKEGGPRPGELADALRAHGSLPLIDLQLLVRWALFNWLFGNCDAHGKNLSLLSSPQGGMRLAPFYDLVCTRVYKPLDRQLAMSFGDQFDPGQVGRRDLEAYAREIQVAPRLVWELFEEILDRGQAAVLQATKAFRERVGESPVAEMIRLQIARNLKRARNSTRQA